MNITQTDPMKEDLQRAALPQRQPVPACPHCGTKPARVVSAPFKLGPLAILNIFCMDCEKIITMFPIGMDEPLVQEPSRILLPN
jgi:hypothetical protein